uniref:Uncharacterized protein n=1 Tax=Aegilops tauschii TaxID=37682 RepID=N1R4X0_AEGTA
MADFRADKIWEVVRSRNASLFAASPWAGPRGRKLGAGHVTDEMLSLPQKPFILIGLLEALAAAAGMSAGAILSGASIPILSQTYLVWQLVLSAIFLKRRYRLNEITGCFLVTVGVVITVASGTGAGASLQSTGILWPLLMIISFFLQAADTVLKEIIFIDAAKNLKGGSVDLFVVNSYGSAYQAIFMCLLLPFLSKLWGIPFHLLPTYIRDGAACFLNMGSLSAGCEGAPLLPLLFVLVNMGFNISLLHLLKISSAVASCLASTFSEEVYWRESCDDFTRRVIFTDFCLMTVLSWSSLSVRSREDDNIPLSIYAFTLPLPYIGVASTLPPGFVAGAAVLIAGLLMHGLPQPENCGESQE